MAEARHRRIAADLTRRIHAGHWQPGQQIPSRVDLAAEYHVHEQTIRLAVTLLRRRGLLEGEPRQRLYVAHPPAMRALTDPDADWPHTSETTDTRPRRATPELAARLGVKPGAVLQHESLECLDPGGRSAMLVSSWWRGRRVRHVRRLVEVGVMELDVSQAHSLGLTVGVLAYRVVRTRLDREGGVLETADLVLPMDRWVLRFDLGESDAPRCVTG
ncbi:GntR family transcriptional regulator [Streptomyces sp. H27-D2]|uniref:GntR family transcriptional regulator n=1 Tax=Streptomyces sp. H27-D2 TaxID=3046304 RepID=UPI002DC05117|nr:GntR family transcriptional regulator [Streptomyces sp. H27-D2]MEC4016133.1 GntR family transcriptional regulator [Streptomyces sp. H27-D2]